MFAPKTWPPELELDDDPPLEDELELLLEPLDELELPDDGLSLGLGDGDGVGDGLGLGEGLGLTLGLGETSGVGLGLGVGVGDWPPVLHETPSSHSSGGVGVGDGLAAAAHEELLTVVLLKVIAAVCAIARPSSVAPPPGKVTDA